MISTPNLRKKSQKIVIFNVKSDVQVCRDPDDDKFISCAVDWRCVYIVSGDKNLLDLKEYEGIEIVTVAEFLELLKFQNFSAKSFIALNSFYLCDYEKH